MTSVNSLRDRVALVTGASQGLGRAIALALGQAGARLAFCARRPGPLEILRVELEGLGADALVLPCDGTVPGQPEATVAEVERAWGRLDILVNNLGGAPRLGLFTDLADKDYQDAFDLNVMTMVRFTRAALPLLRRSSAGRVINISSISGLEPGLANPHYTLTKSATLNLSKHLAQVLAADRITVNAVCPGPIHSEAWDRNLGEVAVWRGLGPEETREAVEQEEAAKVPLGRVGEGEDVAGLVAYLASDQAAWTTGACFRVDGGKSRSMW